MSDQLPIAVLLSPERVIEFAGFLQLAAEQEDRFGGCGAFGERKREALQSYELMVSVFSRDSWSTCFSCTRCVSLFGPKLTHLVMAQSHPRRQSLFHCQDISQRVYFELIECLVGRIDEQRFELVAPVLDFILLEVWGLGSLHAGCAC